ncbi:MAG: hypothetical protein AB1445_00705 [Bacillota bacterium]
MGDKSVNKGRPGSKVRYPDRTRPRPESRPPLKPGRPSRPTTAVRPEESGVLAELKSALAEAANIYFADGTPTPPLRPELGPLAETGLRLEDVAVRLGVGGEDLAGLLSSYPELFQGELGNDGRISETGFLKAAALSRMTRDGLSRAEVLRRMALVVEQRTETAATGGSVQVDVSERLDQLVCELQRSEARRSEERDRFLTALIRTHQEIQHLRYELAAAVPRRARRRRSFLGWLTNS